MRHDLIIKSCQGMGESALLDYISIAMANGYSEDKILKNLENDYAMLAPDFKYEWIKPLIEKFNGSYSTEAKERSYSITKRRNLKVVVIDGKEIGLHKLSIKTGIPYPMLNRRYMKGIKDDTILDEFDTTRGRPPEMLVNIDGREIPLKELSKETGIAYSTLKGRYKKGIRGKEILKRRRKKDGEGK